MIEMKTAKDKKKQDSTEDPLSFLNSLPEVKKKPKPDVFSEHLAFLNSLESITEKKIKSKSPGGGEKESVATPDRVVKKEKPQTKEKKLSISDAKSREITAERVEKAKSNKEPTRSPAKKIVQKPKKKSNTQVQREEKNRLEREKAIAKKSKIRLQREEKNRLERKRAAAKKEEILMRKKEAEIEAERERLANQSPLEKALSFVRSKKSTKKTPVKNTNR